MNKGNVGIVADNYKLPKFREELDKLGCVYTESSFTKGTTSIVIKYPPHMMEEWRSKIQALCLTVEAHYKQSN